MTVKFNVKSETLNFAAHHFSDTDTDFVHISVMDAETSARLLFVVPSDGHTSSLISWINELEPSRSVLGLSSVSTCIVSELCIVDWWIGRNMVLRRPEDAKRRLPDPTLPYLSISNEIPWAIR